MQEPSNLISKDNFWSNILKVVDRCTNTEDAIEDVIQFRRKLDLFSAEEIFDYYFERETNPKEELIWCMASIAYAYFGKIENGQWYAAQWLLFDIIHGRIGKFTDYLESLPSNRLLELSDLSMEIASDNFGWGFNAHGPFQIYSLICLRKLARERNSNIGWLDGQHCFSKNFYRKKYNSQWRELGIFEETKDAIYFSLAAILVFSNDKTVDMGSIDDAAEFTLSICDDPNVDNLEDIKSIRDMIKKGEDFFDLDDTFNFSRENGYYSVNNQMIEFALGVLSKIEGTLSE